MNFPTSDDIASFNTVLKQRLEKPRKTQVTTKLKYIQRFLDQETQGRIRLLVKPSLLKQYVIKQNIKKFYLPVLSEILSSD